MDSSRKQRNPSGSQGLSAPAPCSLALPADAPRRPRGSSFWIETQIPVSREHEAPDHKHWSLGGRVEARGHFWLHLKKFCLKCENVPTAESSPGSCKGCSHQNKLKPTVTSLHRPCLPTELGDCPLPPWGTPPPCRHLSPAVGPAPSWSLLGGPRHSSDTPAGVGDLAGAWLLSQEFGDSQSRMDVASVARG